MDSKIMTRVDENKHVNKVILEYEDGKQRVITKGVFMDMTNELKNGAMSLNFVNMNGKDVQLFLTYMLTASAEILGITD